MSFLSKFCSDMYIKYNYDSVTARSELSSTQHDLVTRPDLTYLLQLQNTKNIRIKNVHISG